MSCPGSGPATLMLTLLKGAGPTLWLLPAAQVCHPAPRITGVRPERLPAVQGQRSAYSTCPAGVNADVWVQGPQCVAQVRAATVEGAERIA